MSPQRPALPCSIPGCPSLQPCSTHARKPWQRTRPYVQPGGSGYAWQRLRQEIIQRDGGRCQLRLEGCTIIAVTADHIVGKAAGGSDSTFNLQAACSNCNESRRRLQAREGRRV